MSEVATTSVISVLVILKIPRVYNYNHSNTNRMSVLIWILLDPGVTLYIVALTLICVGRIAHENLAWLDFFFTGLARLGQIPDFHITILQLLSCLKVPNIIDNICFFLEKVENSPTKLLNKQVKTGFSACWIFTCILLIAYTSLLAIFKMPDLQKSSLYL